MNHRILTQPLNNPARSSSGEISYQEVDGAVSRCHYLHSDGDSVAALSDCESGRIRGFVSTPDETFEIAPLPLALEISFLRDPSFLGLIDDDLDEAIIVDDLYIMKKARLPNFAETDDRFQLDPEDMEFPFEAQVVNDGPTIPGVVTEPPSKTIELGLFVDGEAYQNLKTIPRASDEDVMQILLASVNQLDAIYSLPSLETRVNFAIKVLEIQREREPETRLYDDFEGERYELADSFCA